MFQWIIGTTKAAQVLEGCMAYFMLKREQAAVALEFQKTVTHAHGRCGVPAEVFSRREFFRAELKRLKHISYETFPSKSRADSARVSALV